MDRTSIWKLLAHTFNCTVGNSPAHMPQIGVRDLVARSYFISGARARRGVVRRRRSVSQVVRHRQGSGFAGLGCVPLGHKKAHHGHIWACMGPYISRIPIRDSRVICQGSSGPGGLYWVPTGFRQNLDLARWDLTGLHGSLDCPVSVQR